MITKNRFFRKDSKEAIFCYLYPLLFFPAHGKNFAWAGKKIYPGREVIFR